MSLSCDADSALKSFKLSFDANRVAHAYLLIGDPDGNAKMLAEQMLEVLFCKSKDERPCEDCSGCGRIARKTHPDVMWVAPQKKSRTIQREQILTVQQLIYHTSYEGGWKSAVFTHAERMNDVAANTLLKMLEEPPESTLFLLLSDTLESLLPTIVSRCQRVMLSDSEDHPGEDMDEKLRLAVIDIMANDDMPAGDVIAGMARAKLFLDVLKTVRKKIESDVKKKGAAEEDDSGESEGSQELLDGRVEAMYSAARNSVLRHLLHWYRDMLLCVCGVDDEFFVFKEQAERVRAMSAGLTRLQSLDNINRIEEMKKHIDMHVSDAMAFERCISDLRSGCVSE